ncbi:hypothetical protein HY990_04200 [Candidatus Micrarchaeota archaeon]|nr:hypothetical protein [Candidatus Micrarchaeota archaeon]
MVNIYDHSEGSGTDSVSLRITFNVARHTLIVNGVSGPITSADLLTERSLLAAIRRINGSFFDLNATRNGFNPLMINLRGDLSSSFGQLTRMRDQITNADPSLRTAGPNVGGSTGSGRTSSVVSAVPSPTPVPRPVPASQVGSAGSPRPNPRPQPARDAGVHDPSVVRDAAVADAVPTRIAFGNIDDISRTLTAIAAASDPVPDIARLFNGRDSINLILTPTSQSPLIQAIFNQFLTLPGFLSYLSSTTTQAADPTHRFSNLAAYLNTHSSLAGASPPVIAEAAMLLRYLTQVTAGGNSSQPLNHLLVSAGIPTFADPAFANLNAPVDFNFVAACALFLSVFNHAERETSVRGAIPNAIALAGIQAPSIDPRFQNIMDIVNSGNPSRVVDYTSGTVSQTNINAALPLLYDSWTNAATTGVLPNAFRRFVQSSNLTATTDAQKIDILRQFVASYLPPVSGSSTPAQRTFSTDLTALFAQRLRVAPSPDFNDPSIRTSFIAYGLNVLGWRLANPDANRNIWANSGGTLVMPLR